ncbi:MAG: guanylate kinase [Pseudomonadota bacterium]|jgi:guanylate kinase|nr:guanylate kinase [Alphaproteobacteria bacterium]MCS5597203.1 guanylate kinase [Alphaproteobacteria bacterium]MEC7703012.1 guanylate kinase [Pseudomonadota bacterium]MED5423275.1 guanylate kinase [Pseudomonadota bacterium]|tara:strand:+ start:538 stop:1185 length:648 start_codon:yes stop_codon:yes gene_type:complete
MQNTGLKRRGLMFVLSSPSGAGKTTITRALLEKNPDATMSISATTRPRRAGEVHGQDYFFVDMAEFNEMVSKGDMLEHAKVFGNYYGTPRGPVEDALNDGKDIIFDIDWQGTQQLAEIARDDLVTVFVLPPSSEELERRLNNRARDTREKQEDIKGRMAKAADEMSHYSEYDYVLINKDIDETIKSAQMILDAERMRRRRQKGLSDMVRGMMKGL